MAVADGTRIVGAVIVLYRPDGMIEERIRRLCQSVAEVVVVINAASEELVDRISGIERVKVIRNARNIGLAAALNQGIAEVFSDHATNTHVLLLDQDSNPPVGMADELCDALVEGARNGWNPACAGPVLRDVKSGNDAIAYRGERRGSVRKVTTIATSGTLVSRSAIERIGTMLDLLFIDSIDHEWCHRARSYGFDILVAHDVEMQHDMGEHSISFFGHFKPVYRSPERQYYIVRNTLFLCKLNHIPMDWKLIEFLKNLRRIPFYVFVSSSSLQSIRLIMRAAGDAMKGRMGGLDEQQFANNGALP